MIEDEPPITLPRAHSDPPPVRRPLGLREISPIVLALLQHAGPGERDMDPWIAVPPSRFEQQHARVFVLAQPVGQSAAGRSGTDDDVREFFTPNDRLPLPVTGSQRAGAIAPRKALPHIGKRCLKEAE